MQDPRDATAPGLIAKARVDPDPERPASARPTIAIIGPGAIGCACTAWLGATGRFDLVLCARTGFDELRVTAGSEVLVTRPRVIVSSDGVDPVDFVLVTTKAYDVPSIAPWLRALRRTDTPVAVLQNGVEHVERLRPFVAPQWIVPVIVDCPVERHAAGTVRVNGPASIHLRADELGHRIADLFDGTPVAVTRTSDLVTAAWRKLCLNVAGIVPAILGRGDGVARDPALAIQMHGLVLEAARVARAEGAEVGDEIADEIVARCRTASDTRLNSLAADHRAGRPTEVDARNGAVVRIGARHGIPTPLNERAMARLRALAPSRRRGSSA